VINVSSPNTPGLRDLQRREILDDLLRQLVAARDAAAPGTPLLVKIAPDLTRTARRYCDARRPAASTASSSPTPPWRGRGLAQPRRRRAGRLSGRPLFAPSTALLSELYRLTEGKSAGRGRRHRRAEDAYAKIRAGAALVQLYTALVFEGPALLAVSKAASPVAAPRRFSSIAEAVGADHV